MDDQEATGTGTFDPADALDATFTAVFDAIVPDENSAAAGEGADATPVAEGGAGRAPAAGEEAGAAGEAAETVAGGADGQPVVPADGQPAATGGAADAAAAEGAGAGGVDFDEISSGFGEISVALEENVSALHQQNALKEVREEHANYFNAINQHPRMLVGQEVPSLTGEGMEVLRDSADAKEWQEAVKDLLMQEIRDRADRAMDNDQGMMTTLHGAIDLFQNNRDLVPGTRSFDQELANQFARTAKAYEVRLNGKLSGYSIPVQQLVDQLRTNLQETRKAAAQAQPPAPSAPTPGKVGRPANPAPVEDGPQAGLRSKAGQSGDDSSDFSTLFGTIGLPDLRI